LGMCWACLGERLMQGSGAGEKSQLLKLLRLARIGWPPPAETATNGRPSYELKRAREHHRFGADPPYE